MNRVSGLVCALTCAGVFFVANAAAHEGHEHGGDHDADAPVGVEAPVGTASTPQVEMVVAREAKDIVIYIDDYASNAPIDGLEVQLKIGTQLLQAAAAGDGIYRLPADLVAAPNDAPQTFLLHGGRLDLQLQSVIPPLIAATEIPQLGINRDALIAAISGTLLVLLVGLRALRRRRARSP